MKKIEKSTRAPQTSESQAGKPQASKIDTARRRVVQGALATGGLLFAAGAKSAQNAPEATDKARFPGDPPENFVVYQMNKPDREYLEHIVFSVGAMLRQYGDNIKIVVTAFGPGIHSLLKKPQRPVPKVIREKISSLNDYGVEFHGCGNTLKSLKLTEKDLLPFVKYVEVGASDLLELQKQGYAYISW